MKKKKQKQKHPKLKKVLELAMIFDAIAVASNNEAPVFMMETSVQGDEENLCGTPACHAGWFGRFWDKNHTDYNQSANAMANFLGYERTNRHTAMRQLETWAMDNPDLWGNENGDEMFYHRRAFRKDSEDMRSATMREIADHWYGVAERLSKVEA